jgi:hypothetical protein
MTNDQFIPSVLHVTAKENLDVTSDLASNQTKSVAQLLEENNEKTEENDQRE